jgi:hypothetical protein
MTKRNENIVNNAFKTPYEASKYKELSEACFNVSRGAKPCHWLNYPKGKLQTGDSEYGSEVKYYVVPLDDIEDEIFIYKYDFIKDLIEFVITLNKDDKLRHIINGMLFGYGLAEINEFINIKDRPSTSLPLLGVMKEKAINKLNEIEKNTFMEDEKHMQCDKVLTDILNQLGFEEVVKKYDSIPKYYV